MSTNNDQKSYYYSAKNSYQDGSSISEYEKERFSGILGKYRYIVEQKAVAAIVDMIPPNVTIVDCPCGNGRWWPILTQKAERIIAFDVSSGMVNYATLNALKYSIPIEVKIGDAERLPMEDNSVDYVFSHALTKHLPIPIQYKVLSEFSRVARYGVICSFGVFTHLNYEFWRRRQIVESYPTFIEEVQWMANYSNLIIKKMRKCTTLIGVEQVILFEKLGV